MNKIECLISPQKMGHIDTICKENGYTRAEFTRRALETYLDKPDFAQFLQSNCEFELNKHYQTSGGWLAKLITIHPEYLVFEHCIEGSPNGLHYYNGVCYGHDAKYSQEDCRVLLPQETYDPYQEYLRIFNQAKKEQHFPKDYTALSKDDYFNLKNIVECPDCKAKLQFIKENNLPKLKFLRHVN
jgi:hypothetical protein